MEKYQTEFLELCIANDVLMFGNFTLKSGRVSPYFFNAGKLNNGMLLEKLASSLAQLIIKEFGSSVMLYGPAYKGIPIVAATALQISALYRITVDYAYNRKETKDHGEGGNLVGAPLRGNVIIVDDVITAGTSVNESVKIIGDSGARLLAIVTILDRQETVDHGQQSAVQILQKKLQIPVLSFIKLNNLVEYLSSTDTFQDYFPVITAYRRKYGIKS